METDQPFSKWLKSFGFFPNQNLFFMGQGRGVPLWVTTISLYFSLFCLRKALQSFQIKFQLIWRIVTIWQVQVFFLGLLHIVNNFWFEHNINHPCTSVRLLFKNKLMWPKCQFLMSSWCVCDVIYIWFFKWKSARERW